jgi:hypothetical protein
MHFTQRRKGNARKERKEIQAKTCKKKTLRPLRAFHFASLRELHFIFC